MVQLTLPENSRIKPGKTWPKPVDATRLTEFRIYRWNPDDGANPHIDTYFVDRDDCGPMVLDALIWIKSKIDSTLTFRRSCREGVCGSCAMNIDGLNTLACTRGIDEVAAPVTIYPLPHLEVIKDLVPDLTIFYAQHRLDRAVAEDGDPGAGEGMAAVAGGPRASSTASTSASSAPAARPPARAIGGTATATSARRSCSRPIAGSIDSRDEAQGERLDNLEDPFRLYRCHTIMNCAQTCPKGLNPAKAIARIKTMMVERSL